MEMTPTGNFVPQRGVSVNATFQRCAPRRANNLPTVCPGDPQVVLSVPGLFPRLISRSRAVLSGPYPSHAQRPLKLQSSCPTRCKLKLAPLIFPANGSEEVFCLCISLCAPLSLTFLCNQGCLPSTVSHHPFLPQTMSPHFLPSSVWPPLSL